ncbi:MAG TPA: DEAD/DEAH box helicase family protein [Firmicutes bacterium]|nr:DEAD/DEAH box helicase family protein [Bacillota bacterium]
MKIPLKTYQEKAIEDTLERLADAATRFDKHARHTAISLSAPTGAGKTVIATAAIERLLYGHDNHEPNPEATVLWLTDDPSLNEQTRRKMSVASTYLTPQQLVTIDESLDQPVLDRSKVYFLNIQKLGKGATKYVQTGDRRKHSLWDMISNTIRERGRDFLLIIDEAHRGTSSGTGGKTITARMMDGATKDAPPAPVVLGITATPERFNNAIQEGGVRTLEPVTVDVEEVRDSGLIKDVIRIRHPEGTQPGDATLLEMAVADLKAYDDQWSDYANKQGDPHVRPVLVIQVKAGATDRELSEILDTLSSKWNELDGIAVGHSFQDHTKLNLGSRTVRYVAPQDIQDDPHLRVVLFKEALTTGWDCPRAEVMVSLRSAQDHTYIAQLIGRMVRTPLARRITSNEVLNSVALYLPYYDDESVNAVIEALTSGDDLVSADVQRDPVTCTRSKDAPEAVWRLVEKLPTYTRPARVHRSQVARLNTLALLLESTGLEDDAIKAARTHLVSTLRREDERRQKDLDKRVQELAELGYVEWHVSMFSGDEKQHVTGSWALSARNIDDLFRTARRQLGDASAKWYWDDLCDSESVDDDWAKLRVAALAEEPGVKEAVEIAAGGLVDAWRKKHSTAIAKLGDADRDRFYNVWKQSQRPEQITLIMPSAITVPAADTLYSKHLYSNAHKKYPVKLNDWETAVVEKELEDAVAWYRNPSGGARAIGVPYANETKTTYPDFVFFYEVNGEIVADIIDPHDPSRSDTGPKWAGLADYALKHQDAYRRVFAVIGDSGNSLLALDLKNKDVADRLRSAHSETDIRNLFSEFGGSY